jgi:glutamate synthase domain-containing protein 3
MSTRAASGLITGHRRCVPHVAVTGDLAVIDCRDIHYEQVNESVRRALGEGATSIRLLNVNGQRYIGAGLKAEGSRIEVHGTPGQALAMFMDGPAIEVYGNAQDGVGNTMNAGSVVVHGSAGDVLGYGMRGGRVFVRGDVGYRVGIHMKAYEEMSPVVVCGGKARDFFGEYMAGGLLVLLGMDSHSEGSVVGGHLGTGMHGGEIFVRGEVEPWQCGREVSVFDAGSGETAALSGVLSDYCGAFDISLDEVLSARFTRIAPTSCRPYTELYTSL